MTEEPRYTLAEARRIVLHDICLREGSHNIEQEVVRNNIGSVALIVWCDRCGIRFEEKE